MKNNKTNIFISFLKYTLINYLKVPSFYICAILFCVFLSLNYFIRQQFFTGSGSTDLLLFFSAIPYICILIIPSLCYKQSFSIYDDFVPLPNIQKVLVSYISKLILYCICLFFTCPTIFLVNLFGSIDVGQFCVSIICLIFYGSAVISLCIFIEKLITNKSSIFAISAIILAIFNTAHLFTVYTELPDFLTTICQQLSFAWHFDSASKGILATKDIFFLLGTTLLFVFLADITEEKKKGKVFTTKEKYQKMATILLSMLIILNASRYYLRLDFSANKTYSPSKYTTSLLKNTKSSIKITYYRSSSIAKLYPQIRDVSDFLTTYCNLNKNISLIIKDPDKDEQSKTLLQNYNIQTQQLRTVTSNSTEYVNVYSAIIIEHEGNVEIIPFTMSATTLEYDLDLRIKQLLTASPRIVNIVIGNGMSIQDYNYLLVWLESQNFICNLLNITNPTFTKELLNSSGPLLVIGDSKIMIEQAIAIEDYILQNKGNALLMVSPYSTDIQENWYVTANQNTNIVEIIENWGVTFQNAIVSDISCARITMYADDNNETQNLNYPLWVSLLQQQNAPLGLTMFWVTPLELKNNAIPYLQTSPLAYKTEFENKNASQNQTLLETNPFLLQTVNTSQKQKQTFTVAAEISGKLQGLFNERISQNSKVIVIPDQYFVNSLMNEYISGEMGDYRNFEFTTNVLLKLNGEDELAFLHSKTARDTSFYKISTISQFNFYKLIIYIVCFAIIPLLIVFTGVIFYATSKK